MKRLIPIIPVLILALILGFTSACKTVPDPNDLLKTYKQGDMDEVERLIEQGVDVNAQDTIGWSALTVAASWGDTETAKLLINNGANIDIKDIEGGTPLLHAAFRDHIETVKILVEKGADVNAININGRTALTGGAVWAGYSDIVELLIESGTDIEIKDDLGRTALHWAAARGHTEITRILIESGAEINSKDNFGWTALMEAAYDGYTEIAELLLASGADVDVKCDTGKTALMYAEENSHAEIVELLKEVGSTAEEQGLEVIKTSNIKYSNYDDISRALNIFAPSQGGPWPVVIVVHGVGETRKGMEDLSHAIASQGAVVFNIDEEYYMPFTKALNRLACAVRFAREKASDYEGDPSRIIIVGSSAGAYVGLIVGLAGDDFNKEGCIVGEGSALVYAVVGYEGPFDIPTTSPSDFNQSILKQTDPELWEIINPYTHIGKNPELKVRLIHGTAPDSNVYDVHLEVSTEMHRALVDAGYDAEIYIVEDSPHSALNSPNDDAFSLAVEKVMELVNES